MKKCVSVFFAKQFSPYKPLASVPWYELVNLIPLLRQ